MPCPHCHNIPESPAPARAIEGGRAYASVCVTCGHVLDVRPRSESDPPIDPVDLSPQEIDRLRFVRWRLGDAARARLIEVPDDSPRSAA